MVGYTLWKYFILEVYIYEIYCIWWWMPSVARIPLKIQTPRKVPSNERYPWTPPPPKLDASPAAYSPWIGCMLELSAWSSRFVWIPLSVLRLMIFNFMAIKRPFFPLNILWGLAVRTSLSPKNWYALLINVTCGSLVNGLSICKSRALISCLIVS